MTPSPSRRTLLLGGAGLALGACGVGSVSGGGAKVSGNFISRSMKGTAVGWTVAYPKGYDEDAGLPVVLSLHGRGGTHETSFVGVRLHEVLDEVVSDGTPPFAIASVDGGDHSYWHRRTDGLDPVVMLGEEFLPMLAKRGLDVDRLGLYGWSMGGFGAMLLAREGKWPGLRGVAVSHPALFTAAGRTPAGAFDSAEDFDRNNVWARPDWLRDVPLRIDCGTEDPFYAATQNFVERMRPRPSGEFTRGGHNHTFLRKVAPAQMRFLGSLLT